MATVTTVQANIEYSSSIDDGYSSILAPTVSNIIYIGAMEPSSPIDDGYMAPAGNNNAGMTNVQTTGVLQLPTIIYYFVACNDTGFGRRSWISLSPIAATAIPLAPTPTGSYDATTFVILSSWTVISSG